MNMKTIVVKMRVITTMSRKRNGMKPLVIMMKTVTGSKRVDIMMKVGNGLNMQDIMMKMVSGLMSKSHQNINKKLMQKMTSTMKTLVVAV